jgi:hypothetical protein
MEDKSALKARLAMRPTAAPTILGTVPMMGMAPVDNDYGSIDRMSPNTLRKVMLSARQTNFLGSRRDDEMNRALSLLKQLYRRD